MAGAVEVEGVQAEGCVEGGMRVGVDVGSTNPSS